MAIIAAASITHDRGFHINPKNFKNLLSYIIEPKQAEKRAIKEKLIKKTILKIEMPHAEVLLTFFSSSLLYPNTSNRFWTSSEFKPSFVHLRCSKTSSIGIFSYMKTITQTYNIVFSFLFFFTFLTWSIIFLPISFYPIHFVLIGSA